MRSRFGILALTTASFSLSSRTFEARAANSLETRSSRPIAICTYAAVLTTDYPIDWKAYTLSVRLPGDLWKEICSQPNIIRPMLDSIERRCLGIWSQMGSPWEFEEELEVAAKADEGPCEIKGTIKTSSIEEPNILSGVDCILDPHPQPCGYEPQVLPWPLDCFLTSDGSKITTPPQLAGVRGSSWDRWTPEDEEQLIKLKKEGKSWREIAKAFPGRSTRALAAHFAKLSEEGTQSHPNPESRLKSQVLNRWTNEQDEVLVQLRLEGKSWEEIVAALPPPKRTESGARHRWHTLDRNSNIKSQYKSKIVALYTPKEDKIILKLRREGWPWEEIAKTLSGPDRKRTVDGVRKRYVRLLRLRGEEAAPKWEGISAYTPKEDKLSVDLKESGMTWREIARHFPGRNVSALRGRYERLKLKRERME